MLLQIEEPSPDRVDDPGLAIGLDLRDTGLHVAISVGGNVERVPGPGGADAYLAAAVGYDNTGDLIAGSAGLADPSVLDFSHLTQPDRVDARGASVTLRLSALIAAIRRNLTMATQRPITAAVAVVPLDSAPMARAALLQAIEAGGLDLLRLIEAPVAQAIAAGLAARADGVYLAIDGADLVRLDLADGMIRFGGSERVADPAALPDLIAAEGPIAGMVALGGPDQAVIGAAMLAEKLI